MIKRIVFILFAALLFAARAHAVKVFPNPWIPESNTGKHGSYTVTIKFEGLPTTSGTVHIYNSTGELVRKLQWANSAETYWDGRNDRHEYVASGVYIWVIKEGGTHTGKIVIIR